MAHTVEISDGVLINNLYRILYNEFGEVGFNDIFVNMGIAFNKERGEIGADEVNKIQEWIDRQHEQNNEQIKLLKRLEEFRKISDDKNKFENQLRIVKEIYPLIIKNMKGHDTRFGVVLEPLTDERLMEKLEKFQEHALEVMGFRRDNIVHQFRVFILGCYILYNDKDFWVARFRTDLTKIFSEDILKKYLFSWDSVPGDDNDKLIRFLMDDFDIDWAENAEICKSHDRMTISISEDENSAEIIMNEKKEKAILKISDCITFDLKVKTENDKLNIYLEKIGKYTKSIDFTYVLVIWMTSSLFHDYGKVIEDAQKEFKRVKDTYNEVINDLPLPEALSFNIPLSSEKSIKLSDAQDLLKKNLKTFVDGNIFQIIEESMGERRHATVSSELLNYHLSSSRQFGRAVFYHLLGLASCIAIALHDNPKYFFCSSLTQLLVICDNIQEWNRITAIGDKEAMIFPCRKIYIKLEEVEKEGDGKMKIIQVFLPYERPEDVIAQEIFKRFNPEIIWQDNIKALKAAKGENAFNTLFQSGVKLTVHILFNHGGDSCTLKIEDDGTVESRQTNIYAEFLENHRI